MWECGVMRQSGESVDDGGEVPYITSVCLLVISFGVECLFSSLELNDAGCLHGGIWGSTVRGGCWASLYSQYIDASFCICTESFEQGVSLWLILQCD